MFNYKIKLLSFSIEYFKFSKSICLIEANEGMRKILWQHLLTYNRPYKHNLKMLYIKTNIQILPCKTNLVYVKTHICLYINVNKWLFYVRS
jgi:hypothetical protein